ncbi:PKHD-type hydroxylase [Herbaspirillum sp. Sphag1AN]|uniref:Fe2+-dependent dioxygenase n=1 Tax=unclassified Herbaspirillum TaxID=2624150 RepID=UPI001614BCA2|nr:MULTISPECIES: Fe2+-dependent dioxygenase [unclassified Herbaspirillum]MBB3213538.1 PKHD-type hydroxylase [Herbaspirillum sp. Sphag1AN]MBB3246736.1 PKHD-type hydroxylase [Herbaspirillum sp. Sphag64]
MMLHIPQVLSGEQVRELRSELVRADWIDGKATVGEQGAKVKRNRQLPIHSPTCVALGNRILAALKANPLFFAAALPRTVMPPLFNVYAGGEHYGLHVDGAVRQLSDSTLAMRTDLSSTLFLSAPEEYDGGELVVVDTYGTHEVKLPAGDLILYPATSLHRVEPVTRGERVCSFFWTQSMVRDDWQRSMLFALDQNISSLRASLGDTAEVLGLTGHYHNLLRQWADL